MFNCETDATLNIGYCITCCTIKLMETEPSFRRQEKSLLYFEFINVQRCLVSST